MPNRGPGAAPLGAATWSGGDGASSGEKTGPSAGFPERYLLLLKINDALEQFRFVSLTARPLISQDAGSALGACYPRQPAPPTPRAHRYSWALPGPPFCFIPVGCRVLLCCAATGPSTSRGPSAHSVCDGVKQQGRRSPRPFPRHGTGAATSSCRLWVPGVSGPPATTFCKRLFLRRCCSWAVKRTPEMAAFP